jgi:hypothetical protein
MSEQNPRSGVGPAYKGGTFSHLRSSLCERTSFPYCGLADAIRSDQISLRSFDRVIMLHGGKIIEDGTGPVDAG